ncbi:hypothetical protein QE250_16020 [Chromatiaceae bacterium AAb-1]|nr:hypothetical protein [Chromatiaceae bacterium AAb-1]
MKCTANVKIAVVTMSFVAVVASYALPQLQASSVCPPPAPVDTPMTPAAECLSAEQQSWLSWMKGKSRSTQFHFVDFLELMNRLSPKNNS